MCRRFEHAVGVDASQHVAGCGVQTEVAGRDQSLILVLLQQDDRSFGMVALELFDDVAGAVRGTVVDDDHFMWCDGLSRGVHQAVGDALLLIPRGDDNRNVEHTYRISTCAYTPAGYNRVS